MKNDKTQMQHKVCASEANGLICVMSDKKQMQHKVCASEANGLI